jgi:hypothetical protein
MNTKTTVLCLVLLSATWIVAQSTGSGSAGSGVGHPGTAGQSTTPGQTTSPGNTNPAPGSAAPRLPATLRPHLAPQRRRLELPVPTLEPIPTPTGLRSNRRTARRRQARPHRDRKLLGLPRHRSNRCPTTSHQTISHQTTAPMGARPDPLRTSGIESAKFTARSSVVLSEQFGTPA